MSGWKSAEWHRDFVDALRGVLGLDPIYEAEKEPSPVPVYPDVGARTERREPDLWGSLPARDGWFTQSRNRKRKRM